MCRHKTILISFARVLTIRKAKDGVFNEVCLLDVSTHHYGGEEARILLHYADDSLEVFFFFFGEFCVIFWLF